MTVFGNYSLLKWYFISVTVRDEESVVRSCGWEADKVDRECYTTVLEEYNTEVCSCNTDGCNSADSVSSMSLATTVITGVLAHLYNRF